MERPNFDGSFESVMLKTFELIDDKGTLHLNRLSEHAQWALTDLAQENQGIKDIFDPATTRVEQIPHHQYDVHNSDHRAFLGSTNEFFPIFDLNDDLSKIAPWWRRFAVAAPELHDWLNARESAFREEATAARVNFDSLYASGTARSVGTVKAFRDAFPARSEDHIDALRLAYCITSQLVCEGDWQGTGAVTVQDHEVLIAMGSV